MQNPRLLQRDIKFLKLFKDMQIIGGDRYCPVHAVRINNFKTPENILEREVNIVIPFPRCFGYFKDCAFSGIHIDRQLHTTYKNEPTDVPFCHSVNKEELIDKSGYYPFYEKDSELFDGTYFLCLYKEKDPPLTVVDVLDYAYKYLCGCLLNAFHTANIHKLVLYGNGEGNKEVSKRWMNHLLRGLSPVLKEDLEWRC